MTPATVVQIFARHGAPIVRYAQSPQLCDRAACTGLDYAGSGIRAYLAPRRRPDFELIVFRTPADARQIVRLVAHGGGRISAVRRANVGLFVLRSSTRLARLRAIFRP